MEDVSFRYVKIKIPGPGDMNNVKRRIGGGDLKKVSELRTRYRTKRVDFRDSQRPDEFAPHVMGVQMEKPS